MEYRVRAERIDVNGSLAFAKTAQVLPGADLAGRDDAFDAVNLMLAAVAACMIKDAQRVAPMLAFTFDGVEVALEVTRQNTPPKLEKISQQIVVRPEETADRLTLLNRNMPKHGTILNTLAPAVPLEGTIGLG